METSVLRNYALAFYEEVAAEGQLPSILADLDTLVQALEQAPESLRLAEHPGVALEEKVHVLLAPLGESPPPLLQRFVALLLERHRFADLPELARLLRSLRQEREGRQPVRAETAAELSEEQVARLESALERLLGRPVHVEQEVVPDLIGGLRLYVNNEVLDESLAGRLERMREFLSGAQVDESGPESAGVSPLGSSQA